MNLNEYQELSKRTLPKHDEWEDRQDALVNYSLGVMGEAGECIDHIKKHVFHGHSLNTDEIRNELGDVLHYAAGLATLCGLSLEDIAQGNVDKLRTRYPFGFNKAASIARSDVNDRY